MVRREYSDEDRVRGYIELTVADGNVRQAARNANIPFQTLHRWKQQWEKEGVPQAIQEAAAIAATSFIDDAERVRNLALLEIEMKLPTAKPGELITIVGVLDDKITRARGLATSRHVTQVELPDPDSIRAALSAALGGALSAARDRAEIIDAEPVEPAPKALPVGS